MFSIVFKTLFEVHYGTKYTKESNLPLTLNNWNPGKPTRWTIQSDFVRFGNFFNARFLKNFPWGTDLFSR